MIIWLKLTNHLPNALARPKSASFSCPCTQSKQWWDTITTMIIMRYNHMMALMSTSPHIPPYWSTNWAASNLYATPYDDDNTPHPSRADTRNSWVWANPSQCRKHPNISSSLDRGIQRPMLVYARCGLHRRDELYWGVAVLWDCVRLHISIVSLIEVSTTSTNVYHGHALTD